LSVPTIPHGVPGRHCRSTNALKSANAVVRPVSRWYTWASVFWPLPAFTIFAHVKPSW
jgi:hypothetical protein